MAVKKIAFTMEVEFGFDPFDISDKDERAQEFLAAAREINDRVKGFVGERINAVRIEKAALKISPDQLYDED